MADQDDFAVELLDAIPDAAAIFGADGRLTHGNRRLAALVSSARLEGRTVLELTRSAELGAALISALGGAPARLEVELPSRRATVLAHASPLSSRRALLVLRDVTEAKRLERARRDFVSNASHELRTPVTAIAGAAETLLLGAVDSPSDARAFVEMISRHAERLARLTQELLDLARLEAGEWPITSERLEVAAVARTCLELLRPRAAQKEIALSAALPAGLLVQGDRRALEQILVNLLDNAVKYTPARGTISLEASRRGEWVELAVKDTGPGIEPRHLSRLFERFYRADPGRSREAGGTGLGLAIVKHLAQAQGGEVGVESGLAGSRFWLQLPAG